MGKVLTEVRSSQRKLIPDAEDWEHYELPSLRGIARKAKQEPEHRFRDLSRYLDREHLAYAFSRMNKKAAPGVDEVTYQDYQKHFDKNTDDLIGRLKRQSYKARLVKRKHIPKAPGKTRPLGLPILEDKLLQTVASDLLGAIYEQDFHDFSYGYRPKRDARRAADDLTVRLQFGRIKYIVEADIKGFFNHIDHDRLLEFIAKRVDDKRFLCLIAKWLKAGILEEDGHVVVPEEGTPQGGSISPILANIYLHNVIDEWFERDVKPRCDGDVFICRYADDFVCGFQYASDAERFFEVLPKRLHKYNLEVAEEKTNCIRFSRFKPTLENVFTFLSFDFYWGKDKRGETRLLRRTSRKKLQTTKAEYSEYIKEHRHKKTSELLDRLTVKLRGHYNYFGAIGNFYSLYTIYDHVVKLLYKWLNRRSGRKSMTWAKLKKLIDYRSLAFPQCKQRKTGKRVWM